MKANNQKSSSYVSANQALLRVAVEFLGVVVGGGGFFGVVMRVVDLFMVMVGGGWIFWAVVGGSGSILGNGR